MTTTITEAPASTKMKPEVKAAWVEALRSGEYEQGTDYLHTASGDGPDRFCCLGVLCEVAIKSGLELEVLPAEEGAFRYAGANNLTPREVIEWAGVDELALEEELTVSSRPSNYDIRVSTAGSIETTSLSRLNDSGHTFAVLADIIEEQL